MPRLILVRHGQSQWNLENRFTGWWDVNLTPKGEEEARAAGKLLAEKGMLPTVAFTSLQTRAIKTLHLALEAAGRLWLRETKDWRLNERHYGGLTGLFVLLGVWQVERLAEKEALIGEVDRQLTQPPYDLPPAAQWGEIDLETYAYHPLTVTGTYDAARTVLVFTNLTPAKGKFSGPGYWVMTPLTSDAGGTLFVNRGFIPQTSAASFRAEPGPTGPVTLTGIGIKAEAASSFTPGPDSANRIEWIREPVRLAAMAGIGGPVFGLTLDAPAGEAGALPQGGETVIEFPNNHLGYALTWFGFALITPALLAFWVFRQLRPAP